jgi:hypothetical protein
MKFDPSKSYKFVNGAFVERTPEEQVALEQKRAVHLGTTAKAACAKLPKLRETFIRITLSQANRLLQLKPPAFVTIYLLLSLEHFRKHGQPFAWPTDTLVAKFGIGQRTQQRVLVELVQAGLISVVEQGPPKPPLVTVL